MSLPDIEKRIGIMGGTFNPVHIGHLILAEQARCELNLDMVVFVPAYDPPHKSNKSILSFEQRFEMTQLAVGNNPYFEVSDIEKRLECRSYSINTIKSLISELPENASIYYFAGADQVMVIETWKSYKELLSLCNFVAVLRPGYDAASFSKKVEDVRRDTGCGIMELSLCGIDISSSAIRDRVLNGKSIRYLVPDDVERYIDSRNVYNDPM
jgi:nicotinate-nucleotide adenylyltransferase